MLLTYFSKFAKNIKHRKNHFGYTVGHILIIDIYKSHSKKCASTEDTTSNNQTHRLFYSNKPTI
jgi:hypothetical protein